MSRSLSIAYFLHTLRSDWNNGNAHFLRGLLRSLGSKGHTVTAWEAAEGWSEQNLLTEGERGRASLAQFAATYSDLSVQTYAFDREKMTAALRGLDIVLVHEWNPPELIELLLSLREELGFRALFHDTHHRASSSPSAIRELQVVRFDGVLAFGEALRLIYLYQFGLERVWTLHEAADVSVFKPRAPGRSEVEQDVVWIGNWGEDERAEEIGRFLLGPAAALRDRTFRIYGVRYPERALEALASAGVAYGGYLPNLAAPVMYAASRLTVHIPRQQYAGAMTGIPTIRVFEALACGIPLISAPWQDTEELFRKGDYLSVGSKEEMIEAMRFLLTDTDAARTQASRGRETVLERHTCDHRADELIAICDEVLAL